MELVPTVEAARTLGVTVRTISRWVKTGRLTPAAKTPGVRGAYLFHPADIDSLREEEAA